MILDRAGYRVQWSSLHGGVPATGLVGRWLDVSYAGAAPLARLRVAPWVVTVLGVLCAYAAAALAAVGGRAAIGAAVLVGLSGLADGVDGAVAVVSGRASALGGVLDASADRAADAAYLLGLWWLGAPGGACVGAAAAVVALEYLRARCAAAGVVGVVVLTVGERPTRVIVAGASLLAAGVLLGSAASWAGAGAWVTFAVAAIGAVHFGVVAARALR